jgi:type IV pilus assembly protein PilY1
MNCIRIVDGLSARRWRLATLLGSAAIVWLAGVGPLQAAADHTLELARVPLSVNANVPPNVLVSFDDSGSMGWSYMPDGAPQSGCASRDFTRNRIYYNPSILYPLPIQANGNPYRVQSYTAANTDGFAGTGSVNLSSRTDGTYCVDGRDVRPSTELQRRNFANWYAYYRTRSLAARSAATIAFDRMDQSIRVAWQNFNSNRLTNTTPIGPLIWVNPNNPNDIDRSRRDSFWSWLVSGPGSGATPMRATMIRAGNYFTNRTGNNSSNPYWDQDYRDTLSCRQNFHIMLTDGFWNETTNPSWSHGNTDRVGVTLPDGKAYSNASRATRVYWSESNDRLPTLADIAFYYWSRDLNPDLENNIPPFFRDRSTGTLTGVSAEDEVYFNPKNDPANWQHLVNYIVGFGVSGSLSFGDGSTYTKEQRLTRLRTGADNWPGIQNNHLTGIDDSWHAAVNSRGDYLSASDPMELVDALSEVLDNVALRQSISGGASSSFFVRHNELGYEATYDSSSWSGDITAVREDGSVGWARSAAQQLDSRRPDQRRIFTWVPSGAPGAGAQVPFEFSQLSSEQRAYLSADPGTGSPDSNGPRRVDFLRGDRSLEQANAGGIFRTRSSVLGAIVGSNMVYVERPAQGFTARPGFLEGGQKYSEFRSANWERAPMLYVGASDGMLHAFDALTGQERWAFVPNQVIKNLNRLTSPAFQFIPTVDGKLSVSDVYDGDVWRTVLVGTLGLGGQAVFAIDITNPDAPSVLWEFSDAHDAQLGYNYNGVEITRVETSGAYRWVSLISSGYNNSQTEDATTRGTVRPGSDPHSTNAGPALFVVDAITGQLIRKFSGLPESAQGLAVSTAGEYGQNYSADFAVAGDLNGNLWRFDLGDGSIKQVFQGTPGRPITTAPRIFPDRGNGMVFVFGTGKFLEDDDRRLPENYPRQALIGVNECRSCAEPASESDLVVQRLRTGANGFVALDVTVVEPDSRGWMLPVGNPTHYSGLLNGERFVSPISAEFTTGAVLATSFVPSGDPCAPQGGNVSYVLSAYTGGYLLPGAPNADGDFEGEDARPIFPGATGGDVGVVFVPGAPVPPGMGGNDGSDGSGGGGLDISRFIPRLSPNGCFVIAGVETNLCISPRRRGWNELPVE